MKLHLSIVYNILTPKMFNQFISDRQARHKLQAPHSAQSRAEEYNYCVFSVYRSRSIWLG